VDATSSGAETATDRSDRRTAAWEFRVYAGLVVVLATSYAAAAVLPASIRDRHPGVAAVLFGVDQLSPLRWAAFLLPVLAVGALFLPWERLAKPARTVSAALDGLSQRAWTVMAACVAAYSFLVFISFRNGFVNPDGGALAEKFRVDVPTRGAHVTFDEMLELYVHSRFWYHTSRAFGWSVEFSYQVLSSLSGAVFVFVAIVFARMLLPKRGYAIFFAGLMSAGLMQLFFGDVENYSLVTTLLLLYFFTGYLFLEGRASLLLPTATLALAITFHLLACSLLPSLGYLYVVALGRRGVRALLAPTSVLVLLPAAVGVSLSWSGIMPTASIGSSNALGQGGKLQRFATPSFAYHGQIVSLLLLLFPPTVLVVPLVAFRRVAANRFNAFMAVGAGGMLLYMFVWRSAIGVYNDWNLYAPAALPLAILFWRNFSPIDMPRKAGVTAALLLTSAAHTYAWIGGNHF
jgi:hypothetical protein